VVQVKKNWAFVFGSEQTGLSAYILVLVQGTAPQRVNGGQTIRNKTRTPDSCHETASTELRLGIFLLFNGALSLVIVVSVDWNTFLYL
jgi:hypothetical protein